MNEDEYALNDESVVNSHGFVLLNAAGRFERYNANPVMLFNPGFLETEKRAGDNSSTFP